MTGWRRKARSYNAAMWARHIWVSGVFLAACHLWGQVAGTQFDNAGSTVQAESPPQIPSKEPAEHKFWDRKNKFLFSGVGLFRGLDYASTRNMQARGREEILLPDDVVNNSAAFAGVEAGGTAASVGLSYLMHSTGHHKLERWVSIAHIGVTGFGAARNYALKTHRANAP
jgi:hypothetical protein